MDLRAIKSAQKGYKRLLVIGVDHIVSEGKRRDVLPPPRRVDRLLGRLRLGRRVPHEDQSLGEVGLHPGADQGDEDNFN